MADILEDVRDFWEPVLGAQEIVVVIIKLVIGIVIPSIDVSISDSAAVALNIHLRAGISIEQSLRFDKLLPILAPFTFECLMRLAQGVLLEEEQFA